MTPTQRPSLGRTILTPIVLMVGLALFIGLPGVAIGAAIGVIWILIASRRS